MVNGLWCRMVDYLPILAPCCLFDPGHWASLIRQCWSWIPFYRSHRDPKTQTGGFMMFHVVSKFRVGSPGSFGSPALLRMWVAPASSHAVSRAPWYPGMIGTCGASVRENAWPMYKCWLYISIYNKWIYIYIYEYEYSECHTNCLC